MRWCTLLSFGGGTLSVICNEGFPAFAEVGCSLFFSLPRLRMAG